jgi:hypothetical protein
MGDTGMRHMPPEFTPSLSRHQEGISPADPEFNGSNEVSPETFISHPSGGGFFFAWMLKGPSYKGNCADTIAGLISCKQRVWPKGQVRAKQGAQSKGGW